MIKIKKAVLRDFSVQTIERLWLLEPSGKADLPGRLGVFRGTVEIQA